jgi:glycosyltransferase involved in cell wall biosynthesis
MSKPLLTFFVCAYNQEKFVREAVEGALAQTYSPLEIILSDDCSSDRTFEIMQEMAAAYRGPHRMVLNRNPKNLGVGAHINRIVELSHGELLVAAAGDDISFKERTEIIYQAWVKSSQTAFSIYSNLMEIDSSGVQTGLWNPGVPPTHATTLAVAIERSSFWLWGSSHAFHRKVFEVFGPMDDRVMHEDDAIPFRSLLLGTIEYIAEPLIYYRRHGNNISNERIPVHPILKRRCQLLRADRAKLVSWLQDLRKARSLGILDEEESEQLQAGVIERMHEKSIEWEFYTAPLPWALVVLLRRFLGWKKTFRRMLSFLKRRWQSHRASIDRGL